MPPEIEGRETDPPLFGGPIAGVRAWSIQAKAGGPPVLSSINQRSYWAPGEPMAAECWLRDEPHDVPAPDCHCGIYAWHPWAIREGGTAYIADDPAERGSVIGIIEGWGRTELHADGFRAQFARPTALFASPGPSDYKDNVAGLAEVYGLNLINAGGKADIAKVCAELPQVLDEATVVRLVIAGTEVELWREAVGWLSQRGEAVGGTGYLLAGQERHPTRWGPGWVTGVSGVRIIRVAATKFQPHTLQDDAFDPGRPLRLVPEPGNVADRGAIGIWDSELRLRAGYVPAELTGEIGAALRDGRVAAVRSVWQWRDLSTGERTGLHVLVSATDRLVFGQPSRRRRRWR